MISLKLPLELENRLNNLAAVTHRPKSYYLREALEKYLEEYEDTYTALARLEKPMKNIPLDEVEKRLGLAG